MAVETTAAPAPAKNTSLQQGATSTDDVTRALPHALGPEKSLLSSMLQEPQEYIAVAIEEKLTAEHFYLPSHSTLFGFLIDLFEKNHEVELVSLVQRLLDKGQLERVGGAAAVTDLYTYAPSPGHFRHHLQHVKDKYVLRSIIRHSNEAIAQAYDAPDEVAGYLAPHLQHDLVRALRDGGKTGFAMELVPRISRAQSMDALSSQAAVAGYKAVLIAANALDKFLPMLTTAAGTIRPATVLVVDDEDALRATIAYSLRRVGFEVRTAVNGREALTGARAVPPDLILLMFFFPAGWTALKHADSFGRPSLARSSW